MMHPANALLLLIVAALPASTVAPSDPYPGCGCESRYELDGSLFWLGWGPALDTDVAPGDHRLVHVVACPWPGLTGCPGGYALMSANLNVQVRPAGLIFADGFESGDTSRWLR